MNNGINKAYKIVPVKGAELRRWAAIGFILTSFIGIFSLFWATSLSNSTPFLYVLYVAITIYVLRFAKVDTFSPLNFFMFFSFLGFGLKLPLLSLHPERAFFANPFYSPRFSYNATTISSAFAVFLVGYVAFIVGFNAVRRGIKLTVSEKPSHPLGLIIVSAILILASFYFRSRYLVGVPGYETALIEHAGYIYYPLLYGTIIATGLAFYSALTKGSLFYTIMALILFGGLALSEMLLGWKGGPIYTALILVMIYYYVSRYELRKINTQVRRYVVGAFLVMVLGAVIMYPIVSQYRYAVLMLFGQVDLGAFGEIIKAYALDIQDIRWTSEFLLRRVSGLDNVIPIVAYLQQGAGSNLVDPPSFFANLFGMEIKPEQFYTWYILGVDPNIITTNAPTGWGALYIYGGIMSVLFGMLIIGILSSLFYLTLLSNTHRDGRWVVFYSIFMVNIFLPVVFEGTMINYCKKHFLALAFMYMLSIFVLTSIRYHIPKKLQGGGFCAGKN